MKIKRYFVSNQRKRTLRRQKIRLANRRHTQFASDQFHSGTAPVDPIKV
jgi:hypothetical protein